MRKKDIFITEILFEIYLIEVIRIKNTLLDIPWLWNGIPKTNWLLQEFPFAELEKGRTEKHALQLAQEGCSPSLHWNKWWG